MSDEGYEPNKINIASACSSLSSFASLSNPKFSSAEATAVARARPQEQQQQQGHCTSSPAKEISKGKGDASSPGSGDRVREFSTNVTPSCPNYYDQTYKPDRDLEEKVRKACERISENVHICANEPSLALYRLAEHVRKALPPTVESRSQIQRLHQQLQGVYYDTEYGLESVKSMERSSPHFKNVGDLLKNALFYQQQIKHEQSKSLRQGQGRTRLKLNP